MNPDRLYWEERYGIGSTPWDLGAPAPPIAGYIDSLIIPGDESELGAGGLLVPPKSADLRILIPGAGNGYEAEYLLSKGFRNITVLDIAEAPLEGLRNRVANPKRLIKNEEPASEATRLTLVRGDFFLFSAPPFDLVLEHTFFCAIPPGRRMEYVRQMHRLLKPGGRLAGLFFDFPLTADGPPFGGDLDTYTALFSPHFTIRKLERARNSVSPRMGTELFFIFERK